MRFSVFGFNHHSAALDMREPFQLARHELEEADRLFKEISGCEEAVVVATCHRLEFYRVRAQKGNPREEFAAFFQSRGVPGPEKLAESCYHLHETTAARHLFRVASGLDSMVLGEDQVFHQLKDAYSAACAVSSPGKILHRVFHLAFQAGKRVRAETNLGDGPRGVPGAALNLLKTQVHDRVLSSCLVCGVNQTTEIVLDGLRRWGVPVILANRTLKKAQILAADFGARAIALSDIPQVIGQVEAVISATAAPGYILTRRNLKGLARREYPLYLMDLAAPRDIDPALGETPGCFLFNLQDIQRAMERSQELRTEEIPKAEAIIEEQVKAYSIWRALEKRKGKLLNLRRDLNLQRRRELERFREGFRPGEYRALEAFSQALLRDFLRLAPGMLDDEGGSP